MNIYWCGVELSDSSSDSFNQWRLRQVQIKGVNDNFSLLDESGGATRRLVERPVSSRRPKPTLSQNFLQADYQSKREGLTTNAPQLFYLEDH